MDKDTKENIVKFYSNYRFYIFPAAIISASLFLIFFVIYPQTMQLLTSQKLSGDLLTKSKFLETKVAALENYDEVDLSQKIGYVMAKLPAEKDYSNILGLLQQLTAKSGFSITSIVIGNAGSKLGTVNSYDVKLEVLGTKALFPNLLNNLDNAPRLLRVNDMNVSSSPTSNVLEASLTVKVLFLELPQTFGTEDSPLPQISQKNEELLAKLVQTGEVSISAPTTPAVSTTQPSQPGELSPRGKANPFE